MSGSQMFLPPILSLSDIFVVTTVLHATDNLSLSDIYNRRRRPRMLVSGTQSKNVVKLVALADDFQQNQEAWLRFSPLLNNETIRAAIYRYQVNIVNAIMHLNYICGSCNYFTHPCKLKIIPKDNLVLATTSANSIFCRDQFDSYGCLSQLYTFCKKC